MQVLMNLGYMFGYCVGPYVSYTTHGALSAMFPAIFLGLMLFMPETPYFLLMQGRRDEAEVALMKLRGRSNRQVVQVRNLKPRRRLPQRKLAEKVQFIKVIRLQG
jgi:SP family facilitated glucose transporter-like MFS transporter 8